MGRRPAWSPVRRRPQQLLEAVRERYLLDYADRWNELLEDIGLVQARDIQHAAEITRILADPKDSPLRRLLTAAAEETELDRPPPDNSSNAASSDVGSAAGTGGPHRF